MEEQIRKKCAQEGLSDRVIFAGVRSDIPAVLSAMDVFVFPSLYEGMPNTVIEAQASGLSCLISDSITKEANVINLVEYMSLKRAASEWADNLSTMRSSDRSKASLNLRNQGYSIDSVTEEFIKLIYES